MGRTLPFKLNLSAQRKKLLIPALLGLLALLAFYGANITKPAAVEQLGNLLFDRYQNWKPREYRPDVPVRIIDIDDESLKRIGQWPWPRTTLARMNDRLSQAGAAVISYDVIFSEADRTSPENIIDVLEANGGADLSILKTMDSHDDLFASSIARSNVVLGFFLVRTPTDQSVQTRHGFAWAGTQPLGQIENFAGTLNALPVLGEAANGEGFVSFSPSGDGIVRGAPMVYRVDQRFFPSLSLETLRVLQGAGALIVKSSAGSNEIGGDSDREAEVAAISVGQVEFPVDRKGIFRPYYTEFSGALNKARMIPAWQILDEAVPISDWSDRIEGNIVFVGTGAEGLKDIVATPAAAREPGVVVHAQVVEQIVADQFMGVEGQILKQPYFVGVIENFLIIIPGILLILLLPRLGAAWGAVLSIITIAGIVGYSWYSFSAAQTIVNPVYAVLTIGTTYLIMTIASFYLTESERSRIRNAFSMYLSPTMVKKVSDDPGLLTLGGEERNITILFLDVRSFSKISESLSPQEITTFLNIFLTPMTDTLQDSGATIDKYIGDAIVAFWNAPLDDPEHEHNAARAVLQMNILLSELNRDYNAQDDIKWPGQVAMGIGLNTGICCVGNLGSEQRFSYSMIGDAANLASRIEGLTKQYRVSSMIGDSTAKAVADFAILEADLIRVVGRQTPERIWILAGDETLAQSDDFKAFLKDHARFIDAYRNQDWSAALGAVPALKTACAPWGFGGYYDMISDRIEGYKTEPPAADWGGVFIATSK